MACRSEGLSSEHLLAIDDDNALIVAVHDLPKEVVDLAIGGVVVNSYRLDAGRCLFFIEPCGHTGLTDSRDAHCGHIGIVVHVLPDGHAVVLTSVERQRDIRRAFLRERPLACHVAADRSVGVEGDRVRFLLVGLAVGCRHIVVVSAVLLVRVDEHLVRSHELVGGEEPLGGHLRGGSLQPRKAERSTTSQPSLLTKSWCTRT